MFRRDDDPRANLIVETAVSLDAVSPKPTFLLKDFSRHVGSEQPRFVAWASYLLREALDADAFELAGGGVSGEARKELL